jgi:hypothetical protein
MWRILLRLVSGGNKNFSKCALVSRSCFAALRRARLPALSASVSPVIVGESLE